MAAAASSSVEAPSIQLRFGILGHRRVGKTVFIIGSARRDHSDYMPAVRYNINHNQ
jgi:hypothetical protein